MKKSLLVFATILMTFSGCGTPSLEDLSDKETINGTYYYLGEFETMGFVPIEGQGIAIINPEKTLEIMGIENEYLKECPDFYGSAELFIESIEIPEEEAYGTAPRVEVLGIVSNSGTTCGKFQ